MRITYIFLFIILILSFTFTSSFDVSPFDFSYSSSSSSSPFDTNFTELLDTPSSYIGFGGDCVLVNPGETGLEFGACPGGGGGNPFDQSLNTTDNVTFDGVDINYNLNFTSNPLSSINNIRAIRGISGSSGFIDSLGSGRWFFRNGTESNLLEIGETNGILSYRDFNVSSGNDVCITGGNCLSSAGGSTSPGGSVGNIQFNDGGTFGASSQLNSSLNVFGQRKFTLGTGIDPTETIAPGGVSQFLLSQQSASPGVGAFMFGYVTATGTPPDGSELATTAFGGIKGRNNQTHPEETLDTDIYFRISGIGYDTNDALPVAGGIAAVQLELAQDGNANTGVQNPGSFRIRTTDRNGNYDTRFYLNSSGTIGVNTTSGYDSALVYINGAVNGTSLYATGNISADDFVIHSPFPRDSYSNQEALSDLLKINGSDGRLNHSSIPDVARAIIRKPIIENYRVNITGIDGEVYQEEKERVVGFTDEEHTSIGNMVGVLIKANQEQQRVINFQGQRINTLEQQIIELNNRLNLLENTRP